MSAPGLVQMPRCKRCAAAAAIACSSALAAPLSATSAASLNPPAAQTLRRGGAGMLFQAWRKPGSYASLSAAAVH